MPAAGALAGGADAAAIGRYRGIGGTLEGPSSYFMKSPPIQHPDSVCHDLTEAFIDGSNLSAVAPEPSSAEATTVT